MDIMNEHEIRVSVDQLEELVTLMKNEGANGDDFVYLTDLGRRGVFATHAHSDEWHCNDTMTYYRNYRGKGFYKCDDCRHCVHHDTVDGWVYCHRDYDDDAPRVGYASDELLEACRDFEEVTHE